MSMGRRGFALGEFDLVQEASPMNQQLTMPWLVSSSMSIQRCSSGTRLSCS